MTRSLVLVSRKSIVNSRCPAERFYRADHWHPMASDEQASHKPLFPQLVEQFPFRANLDGLNWWTAVTFALTLLWTLKRRSGFAGRLSLSSPLLQRSRPASPRFLGSTTLPPRIIAASESHVCYSAWWVAVGMESTSSFPANEGRVRETAEALRD